MVCSITKSDISKLSNILSAEQVTSNISLKINYTNNYLETLLQFFPKDIIIEILMEYINNVADITINFCCSSGIFYKRKNIQFSISYDEQLLYEFEFSYLINIPNGMMSYIHTTFTLVNNKSVSTIHKIESMSKISNDYLILLKNLYKIDTQSLYVLSLIYNKLIEIVNFIETDNDKTKI